MTKIAILGGGSWGTALSIVLSRSHKTHEIALWMRDAALAASVSESRQNEIYLPGCRVPAGVEITGDLATALRQAHIVVGAMPGAHAREIYSRVLSFDPASSFIFVSATKGLEPSTHLRMSELLAQLFAAKSSPPPQIAVLSGPSFALEAAHGDPTAVVIASSQESCATGIQQEFAGPSFRVYTNDDVVGVELAGATKNVIAIAAGACQGLGLGTNAIAALITRGLAEMSRLAFALQARPETLSGLAGLGDLVLTCTGTLSRNRQLGIELGKGRALPEILAGTRTVAEGIGTAAALLALAGEHHIELPITTQIDAILHHGKSPRDAISEIMERPQRRE
jgi:glycerol-3-phosphate dehydrogenase (NAD(P)+)